MFLLPVVLGRESVADDLQRLVKDSGLGSALFGKLGGLVVFAKLSQLLQTKLDQLNLCDLKQAAVTDLKAKMMEDAWQGGSASRFLGTARSFTSKLNWCVVLLSMHTLVVVVLLRAQTNSRELVSELCFAPDRGRMSFRRCLNVCPEGYLAHLRCNVVRGL